MNILGKAMYYPHTPSKGLDITYVQQGKLKHQITHRGWYAIKQRNETNISTLTGYYCFMVAKVYVRTSLTFFFRFPGHNFKLRVFFNLWLVGFLAHYFLMSYFMPKSLLTFSLQLHKCGKEGDLKAPFSIATTPRCRGGKRYSFPWITPLYPWFLPYSAEC